MVRSFVRSSQEDGGVASYQYGLGVLVDPSCFLLVGESCLWSRPVCLLMNEWMNKAKLWWCDFCVLFHLFIYLRISLICSFVVVCLVIEMMDSRWGYRNYSSALLSVQVAMMFASDWSLCFGFVSNWSLRKILFPDTIALQFCFLILFKILFPDTTVQNLISVESV